MLFLSIDVLTCHTYCMCTYDMFIICFWFQFCVNPSNCNFCYFVQIFIRNSSMKTIRKVTIVCNSRHPTANPRTLTMRLSCRCPFLRVTSILFASRVNTIWVKPAASTIMMFRIWTMLPKIHQLRRQQHLCRQIHTPHPNHRSRIEALAVSHVLVSIAKTVIIR